MDESKSWILFNKLLAAGVEVHSVPEGPHGKPPTGGAAVRLVRGDISAGDASELSACAALYAATQAAIAAGWLDESEVEF